VALLLMEILTPGGFFVLFFGLGAVLVGWMLLAYPTAPVWGQLLAFSLMSVVSLLLFRKRLLASFHPAPGLEKKMADMVGGVATVADDVEVGALGKGEYRGAPWTVKNTGTSRLAKGTRARIEDVDGLTLLVRAD
jgi:inner membrane protein